MRRAGLLRFAMPGLAVLLIIQMLGQIDPQFFAVWRSEWKLRDGLATVRSGSGRISAQWWYQPSLEFYRQAWGLRFAPIERVEGDSAPLNGYDYYFLQNTPADQLSANHLRPVYRDQVSGLIVPYRSSADRKPRAGRYCVEWCAHSTSRSLSCI